MRLIDVDDDNIIEKLRELHENEGDWAHDDAHLDEIDGRYYLIMIYEGCIYGCKEILDVPKRCCANCKWFELYSDGGCICTVEDPEEVYWQPPIAVCKKWEGKE